jgi:hypothetical protein
MRSRTASIRPNISWAVAATGDRSTTGLLFRAIVIRSPRSIRSTNFEVHLCFGTIVNVVIHLA